MRLYCDFEKVALSWETRRCSSAAVQFSSFKALIKVSKKFDIGFPV
jgi:hypothetical protein